MGAGRDGDVVALGRKGGVGVQVGWAGRFEACRRVGGFAGMERRACGGVGEVSMRRMEAGVGRKGAVRDWGDGWQRGCFGYEAVWHRGLGGSAM